MARHTAQFRSAAGRSRLDADVEALVSLCGWLVAVVFVVGFVRGWWWGGDLHNLPWGLERRGWPLVPVLAAALGAVCARWVWLALADLVRGTDPRIRRRGWRL